MVKHHWCWFSTSYPVENAEFEAWNLPSIIPLLDLKVKLETPDTDAINFLS